MKETHQANLMFKLTAMIDGAIHHRDPDFKSAVRKNRKDFFCGFPPLRVWLYVKILRDPENPVAHQPQAENENIEDNFVDGTPSLNISPTISC